MLKFQFKVRTRTGSVVENLNVQGVDRADAERKLLQMYRGAEILEGLDHGSALRDEQADLASILSLISRQDDPPPPSR
jgi:hypothetical protein